MFSKYRVKFNDCTKLLLGIILYSCCSCPRTAAAQQSATPNRVIAAISEQSLTIPRRLTERPTTTNIYGATCKATEWDDAYVTRSGEKYSLEYSKEIDVEDNSDACLEGEVPAI